MSQEAYAQSCRDLATANGNNRLYRLKKDDLLKILKIKQPFIEFIFIWFFCLIPSFYAAKLLIKNSNTSINKKGHLKQPFFLSNELSLCKLYLCTLVHYAASLQLLCFARTFVLCKLESLYCSVSP